MRWAGGVRDDGCEGHACVACEGNATPFNPRGGRAVDEGCFNGLKVSGHLCVVMAPAKAQTAGPALRRRASEEVAETTPPTPLQLPTINPCRP
jgi:hypothetical protein